MAQIIINSSEIPAIVDLVEQLLPGVNLTIIKKPLEGVKLNAEFQKQLSPTELAKLTIVIN